MAMRRIAYTLVFQGNISPNPGITIDNVFPQILIKLLDMNGNQVFSSITPNGSWTINIPLPQTPFAGTLQLYNFGYSRTPTFTPLIAQITATFNNGDKYYLMELKRPKIVPISTKIAVRINGVQQLVSPSQLRQAFMRGDDVEVISEVHEF